MNGLGVKLYNSEMTLNSKITPMKPARLTLHGSKMVLNNDSRNGLEMIANDSKTKASPTDLNGSKTMQLYPSNHNNNTKLKMKVSLTNLNDLETNKKQSSINLHTGKSITNNNSRTNLNNEAMTYSSRINLNNSEKILKTSVSNLNSSNKNLTTIGVTSNTIINMNNSPTKSNDSMTLKRTDMPMKRSETSEITKTYAPNYNTWTPIKTVEKDMKNTNVSSNRTENSPNNLSMTLNRREKTMKRSDTYLSDFETMTLPRKPTLGDRSMSMNQVNRTGTLRTRLRGVKRELLERQTSLLIQSMTIDELYLEILYEILHNVGGCDVGCEVGQPAMLSHVQEAFKMSNDKHTELLTQAEAKEPPELMLNVELVEAKDLVQKDPNGLSDPFVTIYLMSNSSHRYNTSVKLGTLNPSWEEHFSLPMPENVHEDSLCLEVWDFDPAETVKEKMGKFFKVKGVKGFHKLMKEIYVTASTGKHDNELIGTCNIPLKSIPAGGLTMWYNLSKKSKLRRQGVVKVRLNFSSEKSSQVAAQEHRHLLRILLLHELETSKVAPFWWCGNWSAAAEAVLTQHAAQSGLTQTDNAMAQWSVYCAVTADHPLSFALFNGLIDKLAKPLQAGLINEEDAKLFWDGARKLLPTCFSHIRKLRKKTAGDKTVMKTLREVLKILQKLSLLDTPDMDLFPVNQYGWLRINEGKKLTIHDVLNQAALQGASEWFVHILDNNECKEKSEEARLQHLIRVIQLVRSDLQRAIEYYDRVFVEVMSYPYSRALYGIYENKIASLVEPEVKDVCKSLKRLQYNEGSTETVHLAGGLNGGTELGKPNIETEPLAMGTTLFELYLTLQRFLTLGQGLNESDWSSYSISKFHSWFHAGVAQWLDIAAYKALTRIEKAIDLDNLVPVYTDVKYSSSAVDTRSIFSQIKIFWEQLAWPEVEGCYAFVAKIVDDICRCCVFYSDRMSARVDNIGTVSTVYEDRFEVTTDWCIAINNIDFVRLSLPPYVNELGMADIIQKLSEQRSPIEAQRCKDTLENVIANAIDTIKNKIVEVLEVMVKKMMPSITRFLVEGAELLHQDCSSMDRVMRYLEANLDTLHQHLSYENFSRTLDIVWEQLGDVLYELIQANLEKRRPPSFFSNLHECLKIMIRSFVQDDKEVYTSDTLKRVEYLLKIHGMETRELIHQYHLERWQEQQSVTDPKLGILTVRAQFIDDNIKLEIMNARNLVPTDSNGLCDSYVRVALLPEDTFVNVVKVKTQTHSKNLFPLYDEMFIIPLTPEQRRVTDGLMHLVVKDKDMFSMNNAFVGEAYLSFNDIPATPAPISSLPQQHLPLSKPSHFDGDAIKALESRPGDKQAREFLKKQRQKMPGKQFFSLS